MSDTRPGHRWLNGSSWSPLKASVRRREGREDARGKDRKSLNESLCERILIRFLVLSIAMILLSFY